MIQLKAEINQMEELSKLEIEKSLINMNTELIQTLKKNSDYSKQKLIKQLLDDSNIIILNNIQINCNIIIIEKMDTLYLHMSILQIFGEKNGIIQDYIQNNKTKIIMSSIFENNNSDNCKDSNLKTFMSTSYNNKDTQFIKIILPEFVNLHKIIIYNKMGKNKEYLIPFQIKLYNNDYLEQLYTKNSFDKPFISDNYIKLDRNLNINDKGIDTKFRTVANIDGYGDVNYCRFIKHNNKDTLVCSSKTNEYKHIYENFETSNDTSFFKHKNKNTTRDDICRCVGYNKNAEIICRNSFNQKDFLLKKYPNCDVINGTTIQNRIKQNKILCNNTINFNIDAGFYWKKMECFFLFRNTTFNNKKIILFTCIDEFTFRIRSGYPKIINNQTWNNLSLTDKIDSAFVVDNTYVIFIKGKYYVKYNMITRQQLPNYPKTVKSNFYYLPELFHNNITSSMNIGNNIVLLFNNLNYIEYNINSIENENAITYPASIKYSLKNKFPGIRLNKWDGIISKFNDIIIIFLNEDYYIYDIGKNKIIIKTSMRKQWSGIWKVNINNL